MKVRGQRVIPLRERLLSFVSKASNGCWLWTGAVQSETKPYGRLIVGSRTDGTRRSVGAHRLSYTVHKGEIPAGMCVCHTCDNPSCVNPDHLFLGTKKDNADDRDRKGRLKRAPIVRGQDHAAAKLTNEQVNEIRHSTEPSVTVAARYGVGDRYIRQIREGVARVPPPQEKGEPRT